MALTATAGKKVKDDIRAMLKMRPDCVISALSVDRANLAITVTNERVGIGLEGNLRFLVDRADSAGGVAKLGATIVYCTTQKEVDAVASMLRARLVPGGGGGKTVMQYHAGLPAEARKEAHYAFLTGECVVLVATVAFGMGIDKVCACCIAGLLDCSIAVLLHCYIAVLRYRYCCIAALLYCCITALLDCSITALQHRLTSLRLIPCAEPRPTSVAWCTSGARCP